MKTIHKNSFSVKWMCKTCLIPSMFHKYFGSFLLLIIYSFWDCLCLSYHVLSQIFWSVYSTCGPLSFLVKFSLHIYIYLYLFLLSNVRHFNYAITKYILSYIYILFYLWGWIKINKISCNITVVVWELYLNIMFL